MAMTRSVTDECTAEKCADYCSLEANEAEGGIAIQDILEIGDLSGHKDDENGTKCSLWRTKYVSNGSSTCYCNGLEGIIN